jgi:Ca2+-dependent lipid-binding protein
MKVKELRSLEVILLTKVTLVPLPVSLKQVFLNAKLRVQITFQSTWPMIKTIDLGCVSLPQIDFSLKPLGADIAKVVGLGPLIKDIVDNQLKNIIVNPNKYTIPLGEWMGENAGGTEVPVGVLRVVVFEAKGLKNVDVTGVIKHVNE